ncbi:hypothetical protein BBP40_011804, partial [Aspergillus hancockii]
MAVGVAPSTDTVLVTARQLVQCANKAALAPLESPFHLGPMDHLVFPFVPIQVVLVYKNAHTWPNPNFKNTEPIPTKRLQTALSHLLNYYPHLTGRLQFDPKSKAPEIASLGTGAELLEAECSRQLDDIASASTSGRILMPNLPASGSALLPLFDPTMEGVCRDPILAIKHTRFACGGVALGIRLHHIVCDAHGFFQLVRDLAEIYRGLRASESDPNAPPPTLAFPPEIRSYYAGPNAMSEEEREEALKYQPSVFYQEPNAPQKQNPPPSIPGVPQPPVRGRILRFSGPSLHKLKTLATAPNEGTWVSTFEALSAYLYQRIYLARLQHLQSQGMSLITATSHLSSAFFASINIRPKHRLNLPERYFPNAIYCPYAYHPHSLFANTPLWQVAKALHELLHSVPAYTVEKTTKWVAAQPDKSRIKMNFEFGKKSTFTVSQWSKFGMYVGMDFDVDERGAGIVPVLVSPPFTEVSLVDGLGIILGTEEEVKRAGWLEGEVVTPCALDVQLSLSEPLWWILDGDE